MATFTPQNAVVYALTADHLYSIFTNNFPGPYILSLSGMDNVPYVKNTYATVSSFSYSNMPAGDPQAIQYLFPSTSSTGPNSHFLFPTSPNNQDLTYTDAWFSPFDSISTVAINSVNPTATANLNTANLTGNETVVASSRLKFTFIPGSTQSLALTYAEGTTLSTAVTNGITNTSTTGQTTTVTVGTKVTGTIPGASAEVNASVSEAWNVQESKAVNYSESKTQTVNTNTSTTVTVDVNSATPTGNGQWVYQNSNGDTFYLVPGNKYIAEIQMNKSVYTTPISNTFNISGPDMTEKMTLQGVTHGHRIEFSFLQTGNVEQTIAQANQLYAYSQYSGVDPSLFSYQTIPVAQVVYTGLVNSISDTGTDAEIVILPVLTTNDLIPAGLTVSASKAMNAVASDTLSIDTTGTAVNAVASDALSIDTTGTVTKLDLLAAASKLSSHFGIYYDNTSDENLFQTHNVEISGADHATLKVGNLDYTLTNFSNSTIELGSGNNKVILTAKDINNSITFGSGDNQVELNGAGNNIHLGNGANWVKITGGNGVNFVDAGTGPNILTFNTDSGFTQVSNWNSAEDAFVFSPDIDRNNIHVTFDTTHWSYDVYVNGKLVADVLTTGGLKFANEASAVYSQIYAAPMPYNVESNEGFVNGLYVDAFSRVADSSGISFWTEQLEAGVSRKTVIQDFLVSSEYIAEHLSNNQYIKGLYQDILGRHEDTSGAVYWVGQLDSGVSRATVVGTFLASAEFNNLVGIS
jgi:hypothetical protein